MSKIENTFAWGKSGGSSEVTREEFEELQSQVVSIDAKANTNLNNISIVDAHLTQTYEQLVSLGKTILQPKQFESKDYVDYGNFVDGNNRNIRIVVFWGRPVDYEFPHVLISPLPTNNTNNFKHVINIQTAISYYDTTHPALWLILYREDNQLVANEGENINQYFKFYGWYSQMS